MQSDQFLCVGSDEFVASRCAESGKSSTHPDPGLAPGHNRVAEGRQVHTPLQEFLRHLSGQRRIKEHDGHNGVRPLLDVKASLFARNIPHVLNVSYTENERDITFCWLV